MLLTGILTISAFLLIARGATKQERSPVLMATGILLLVGSAIGHFFAYSSLFSAITALSAEVGVGLFFVAGFLSRHNRPARPIFFVGSISLVLCVILLGVGRFFLPADGGQETVTLLVELGPDDSINEINSILEQFDARYERAFPDISLAMDIDLSQVYIVSTTSENELRLRQTLEGDVENVDHVEVNEAVGLYEPVSKRSVNVDIDGVLENDPLVNRQWALEAIDAHKAHEYLQSVEPVRKAKVAIVDTGVDGSHEDIRSVFATSPGNVDLHGHGSHCAGLAGAVTNNAVGIASLNWEGKFVEVTAYKALNDQGMGTIESIAQSVLDASRDGADVISMSLGGKSPTAPKTIADAIRFAIRNDAVVIVSAGNSNEDAKYHMPSNVAGVIVVSAVDEELRKATFSNTNTSLARPIAAPGVNILSLQPNGRYVEMSGTSMSTPIVSGLVGVMRSLNPDITAEQVYNVLRESGKTLKDSNSIGRLVNASSAIEAAVAGR
jgi:thermitase